jgi:hypothetical protein
MSNLELTPTQIDDILSTKAIRERAALLFARCERGEGFFRYHPERLKPTLEIVMQTIRKNYPDLKIPFHSRWGHFRAGGLDRIQSLSQITDLKERARVQFDLVIPSVLLDAGAGQDWKYLENGIAYNRSEGLGVASLHMFFAGAFAADGKSAQADRQGLSRVDANLVAKHFQVSLTNPLVGVEGRAQLLKNLGGALENQEIFPGGRPGNMIDSLEKRYGRDIPAPGVLRAVLDGLGSIWPGRISSGQRNLGDVWRHSALGSGYQALVPIHKLSQWMTYSLLEPLAAAGFSVSGVEELTGLAEYRNGGLFLDSGLLSLAEAQDASREWTPDSELVIEWRALTVHLLDIMADEVQKQLGKSPQEFPLAKVLEGGTWWAGRFLAQERRAGGGPPLKIKSDGTVF